MDNYTKTPMERPVKNVTPQPHRLTDRDHDILCVLCRRLRILSTPQVARIWWSKSEKPGMSS